MKKSLAKTNKYLLNPALKKVMIMQFVITSSAIEGIQATPYKKSMTHSRVKS